ncbi:MAG: type 1 glutamine amidotransferase [Francisellaceae bacterium]|jgi:type 1 glutamine amidotransferase
MNKKRVDAYLVCGGDYHDMDFARLELLKLLGEHMHIRVKVSDSFNDIDAICDSDFLITYTCNVVPSSEQTKKLKAWLNAGHRWLALHGTNSICRFLGFDPLCVGTPREAPEFMEMLGSQFLAHPPLCDFKVEITDPTHELTKGLKPFETFDELYLSEFYGKHQCLLHTHFSGDVPDFEEGNLWNDDEKRPVMYINNHEKGQVLYLTLGHCRGTYDMQPLMEEYPDVERCSWELDIFYELLRRGINWCSTKL